MPMWNLDFSGGFNGDDHKSKADKVMEMSRVEVFGAGPIDHAKKLQTQSQFDSPPPSSSPFNESSSSSVISEASTHSSTILFRNSKHELKHEPPPYRSITYDEPLVDSPIAPFVVPQTPSSGGWGDIHDSTTQTEPFSTLIPHRGSITPLSSVSGSPSSTSKICKVPYRDLSTPNIHQHSMYSGAATSFEGEIAKERSAWLTEKKKEWGKRRCFKSELGTVDELKRIPQVEGRRTFKRGNISADMPIQKLVDLVEMDYRNIESNLDPPGCVIPDDVQPLPPQDDSKKENKKRQLGFSQPLASSSNISSSASLIPHSTAVSLSGFEKGPKRIKMSEALVTSGITVTKRTLSSSAQFQFLPLPPPILNHSSKIISQSKLLVQIPHRPPELYQRPDQTGLSTGSTCEEVNLAPMVNELFNNYTEETARALSNLANGYPVGYFFLKSPKRIGTKEEQRARAKIVAKEFCRFASKTTKKTSSLRAPLTGFVSFRDRGSFSYMGAFSGVKVPLDIVSSRIGVCDLILSQVSTQGKDKLGYCAIKYAKIGCLGGNTVRDDHDGKDTFTSGSDTSWTVPSMGSTSRRHNREVSAKYSTKGLLKQIAGGRAVLTESIAWLKEKKKAKKEAKKIKASSKKRTKELLAAVKKAKQKLLEMNKSDSDEEEDSEEEKEEQEETARVRRGAEAKQGPDEEDIEEEVIEDTETDEEEIEEENGPSPTKTRTPPSAPKPRSPSPVDNRPCHPGPVQPQALLPPPPLPPLHGLCSIEFSQSHTTLIQQLCQHGVILHSHTSIDIVSCEASPTCALILRDADVETKLLIRDISILRTLQRYKHIFIVMCSRAGKGLAKVQTGLTDLHNCAGDAKNGDMVAIMHTDEDNLPDCIKEIFEMSRGKGERGWLKDFVGGRTTVLEKIEHVIHDRTHWSVFQAELEFGEMGP